MTEPLSPAAQAVRDAVLATYADNIPKNDSLWNLERASTVAALQAAADQVVPLAPKPSDTFCCPPVDTILWKRVTNIRNQLLAIAAELEAQP